MTEPSLFWSLLVTVSCLILGLCLLYAGFGYLKRHIQAGMDNDRFWAAGYIVLGCFSITVGCSNAVADLVQARIIQTYKGMPELCKVLVSQGGKPFPNQSNGGTK